MRRRGDGEKIGRGDRKRREKSCGEGGRKRGERIG
jgi:hypothetical protein